MTDEELLALAATAHQAAEAKCASGTHSQMPWMRHAPTTKPWDIVRQARIEIDNAIIKAIPYGQRVTTMERLDLLLHSPKRLQGGVAAQPSQ